MSPQNNEPDNKSISLDDFVEITNRLVTAESKNVNLGKLFGFASAIVGCLSAAASFSSVEGGSLPKVFVFGSLTLLSVFTAVSSLSELGEARLRRDEAEAFRKRVNNSTEEIGNALDRA